jgi:hypothetical protein
MTSVTPEELKFAARELANLLGSHLQFDTTVHARLRALIAAAQQASFRGLIEDKIVRRLRTPAAQGDEAAAAVAPVTAADLKRAGLTLEAIVAQDATLTGLTLVLAGVISTHAHMLELGVATFTDMVRLLGPPHALASALFKATRSKQAWEGQFLPHLKFDFAAWLASRDQLTPADLCHLHFWLGTHLDTDPDRAWPAAKTDVPTWLTKAPAEDWIKSRQLRPEQYAQLAGPTHSLVTHQWATPQ